MYSSSLAEFYDRNATAVKAKSEKFHDYYNDKDPSTKKEKIKILTDNLGVSLPRAWKRTYQVTATSLKYETE